MSTLILVSTQTNSQANAKKLARLAVEQHLAASASITAISRCDAAPGGWMADGLAS